MIKKIVCLGDSITYGYNAYPEDAWPARAAALTGLSFINCGINGDTAAGMLWRFYEDVVSQKPDLCIIMGGTNDILQGRSGEQTADIMGEIVCKAQKYKIPVVVAIPIGIDKTMVGKYWPCTPAAKTVVRTFEDYVRRLRLMTGEQLAVLDVYEEYKRLMKQRQPDGLWYQDGVHPTREGYHVLGDLFAEYIRKQYMPAGERRR